MPNDFKMFRVEIINKLYGDIRLNTVFAQSKQKALLVISKTVAKDECISRCEEL